MAADLRRYLEAKERAEEARRRADRAAGALEGLRRKLQEEFGCASLKEGKALLARMEKERDKKKGRLDALLEDFEAKYAKLLEGT